MISTSLGYCRLSTVGHFGRRGFFTALKKEIFNSGENHFNLEKLVIHELARNDVQLSPTYASKFLGNRNFNRSFESTKLKELFATNVDIITADPHSDGIPNIVKRLKDKASCHNLNISSTTQESALDLVEVFKPQKVVIKNFVDYKEDFLGEECLQAVDDTIDLQLMGKDAIDLTKRSADLLKLRISTNICCDDQIIEFFHKMRKEQSYINNFDIFYPVSPNFEEKIMSTFNDGLYKNRNGILVFSNCNEDNEKGYVEIEDDRVRFRRKTSLMDGVIFSWILETFH